MTTRKEQRKISKRKKLAALAELTGSNDDERRKSRLTELVEEKLATTKNNEVKQNRGGDYERWRQIVERLDWSVVKTLPHAELKRRLKERGNFLRSYPRLNLKPHAEASLLSVAAEERGALRLSGVKQFLRHSLCLKGCTLSPDWISLQQPRKLTHVVTVLIEGVSLRDLNEPSTISELDPGEQNVKRKKKNKKRKATEAGLDDELKLDEAQGKSDSGSSSSGTEGSLCVEMKKRRSDPDWLTDALPRTSALMHYKMELLAPAKNKLEELLDMSQPESLSERNSTLVEKGRQDMKIGSVVQLDQSSGFPFAPATSDTKEQQLPAQSVPDKYDRRMLMLSSCNLRDLEFPTPGCPSYQDFVFTVDQFEEVRSTSPMFGVDCEMCMTTTNQLELTSISVVNEKHELVYQSLVKPHNPIINYLTRFSGITEARLADVTTRLSDVQQELRRILPRDAILVGHSLHCDLKAMKMMHPYVMDTSLLYNVSDDTRHRPSLKSLAWNFLEEQIQDGCSGHDPTEDASATLKLVQLKLQHDVAYGNVLMGGFVPGRHDYEQLQLQWVNRGQGQNNSTEARKAGFGDLNLAFLTTPGCMEGYGEMMELLQGAHVEVLPGNKQLSQAAKIVAMQKDFTFIHMKMDGKLGQCESPESRQHHLRKLDKRLQRIYKACFSRALIIYVFSGSTLDSPEGQHSNGIVMISVKDDVFWS